MNLVLDQRVLLFDIDGTLLLSGGAGMRALDRAFEKITGSPNGMNDVIPDGKTDYLIVEEAFRMNFPDMKYGKEETEIILNYYLEFLEEELINSKNFRLMPGVPEILDSCRENDDILLGLATGNLEKGSELKLRHADLWDYFKFGGYGSDAIDRTDVVKAAIQKATAISKEPIELKQIFVIGDTPNDIICAHEAGVKAIGVGAARYSCRELLHHKPDFLLEDLTSPEDLFRCLYL